MTTDTHPATDPRALAAASLQRCAREYQLTAVGCLLRLNARCTYCGRLEAALTAAAAAWLDVAKIGDGGLSDA